MTAPDTNNWRGPSTPVRSSRIPYDPSIREALASIARYITDWGQAPTRAQLARYRNITIDRSDKTLNKMIGLGLVDSRTMVPTALGHDVLAHVLELPGRGIYAKEADASIPLYRLPSWVRNLRCGEWSVLLEDGTHATVKTTPLGEFWVVHETGKEAKDTTLKGAIRKAATMGI